MIFIAYILFLTYWALEGYSTAICQYYVEDRKYLRRIRLVSYAMRSLFVLFTFGLVYFYSRNFFFSISMTLSFLLGAPNFYKGFKFSTLSKLKPNRYKLGWYDSNYSRKQDKLFDAKLRVFLLAVSSILVIVMTLVKQNII